MADSTIFVLEPLEPRLLLSADPMVLAAPDLGPQVVEHSHESAFEDELGLDGEFIEASAEDRTADIERAEAEAPVSSIAASFPAYANPETAHVAVQQQAALLHLANGPPRSTRFADRRQRVARAGGPAVRRCCRRLRPQRLATAKDEIATGIEGGRFNNVSITNNIVYGNSGSGIHVSLASIITGNSSYGNATGIRTDTSDTFTGRITNNIVYDNSVVGIEINNARDGTIIVNNSVIQPLGNALRVQSNSDNARVRKNIFVVESGFAISVADDSQAGFDSDSNLVHTPGGKLGFWNSVEIATLLDWRYEVGFDANSILADPSVGSDSAELAIAIGDVNEAPVVSLANTVVSLSEDEGLPRKVADVVLDDDALGERTLELTGEDAALFELVGLELFLRADAVLDFETNPQLDVAVTVTVTDPDGLSASATVNVDVNFVLEIGRGWNHVSLPVDPDAGKVQEVFAEAPILGRIFQFAGLRFELAFEAESERGYWFYSTSAASIAVPGQLADNVVEVNTRWNSIGAATEVASPTRFSSVLAVIRWDVLKQRFRFLRPTGYLEAWSGLLGLCDGSCAAGFGWRGAFTHGAG